MVRTSEGRETDAPAGASLRVIYRHMSHARRKQLAGLFAVMLGAAAAEMVAILAVLPFVSSAVRTSASAGGLNGLFPRSYGLAETAALLIGAAVVATLLRLLLLRTGVGFVACLAREIGESMFGRILRQPYRAHAERHSSELLSGIEKLQLLVSGILLPLVQAVTGGVVALGILAVLIAVSPAGTAIAASFVLAGYGIIAAVTRRGTAGRSKELARLSHMRIKAVQDALGAIRDIILDGSHATFESRFGRLERSFREAQATQLFLIAAPRHVVELAAIGALTVLALVLSAKSGGILGTLPIIAALGFGAQRLLPLVQQAWVGWSQVAGNRHALGDVANLLDLPAVEASGASTDERPRPFRSQIRMTRASLKYSGRTGGIEDVTLAIRRGEHVGIVGPTGSGKSTLLDLLMGLSKATAGSILIDGVPLEGHLRAAWHRQIAHVSQSIYLLDDSIAANIALSDPAGEVDERRVREAAGKAHLDAFVRSLPDGLATRVGERGVRLSGGQRQQIGLARAFYKTADVFVLDEATSALDEATERSILAEIRALGDECTVLIVAHRSSTLASCDRILRVDNGRVEAAGPLNAVGTRSTG